MSYICYLYGNSVLVLIDVALTVLGAFSVIIISANSTLMLLAYLSRARPLEVVADKPSSTPDVTILVPAYREGNHIHYFLKSLSSVDYPKNRLRLVIVGEVDDPETYGVLSNYCEVEHDALNCGGVRGVYIVNTSGIRGKPAALNFALRYVNTEIVAVYDAEDSIHPSHVSIAVKLLIDPEVAAIQFVRNIVATRTTLEEAQSTDFEFYYTVLQPYLMSLTGLAEVCGSAFYIKLSYLESVGGFNSSSPAEDLDLTYRIASRRWRILLAFPPSTTRPITRTSSLIKQRARWIRGGILAIPAGLRALPRSLPLLLITGLTPLTTVTSTLTVTLGLVSALLNTGILPAIYTIYALAAVCLFGAVPVLLANSNRARTPKYLTIMPAIYYLATWRAFLELLSSPRAWTRSDSKA